MPRIGKKKKKELLKNAIIENNSDELKQELETVPFYKNISSKVFEESVKSKIFKSTPEWVHFVFFIILAFLIRIIVEESIYELEYYYFISNLREIELGIIFGIPLILWGLKIIYFNYKLKNWENIEGVVRYSNIIKEKNPDYPLLPNFKAVIGLVFKVGEKEYTCKIERVFDNNGNAENDCLNYCLETKQNLTKKVYYDPKNPKHNAENLEKAKRKNWQIWTGVIFIIFMYLLDYVL